MALNQWIPGRASALAGSVPIAALAVAVLLLHPASAAAADGAPRAGDARASASARADSAPAATPDDSWREGGRLFQEGRRLARERPSDPDLARDAYRRAADAFLEPFEKDGLEDSRAFTNAANAYLLSGDRGDAALWYARALLLDPTDERAARGLSAVRTQDGWSTGSDAVGVVARVRRWSESIPFSERRAAFIALWAASFLLLALGRRRLGLAGTAGGIVLLASLLVSVQGADATRRGVLRVSVEGRTGDGDDYGPSRAAPLPAGSEVEVVEKRGERESWLEVSLPDGSRAWVPDAAVARIALERRAPE